VCDLAVAVALGGDCLADGGVLRAESALFGRTEPGRQTASASPRSTGAIQAETREAGELAQLVTMKRPAPGDRQSAFGEDERVLRLRLATGLLYGDSDAQQETALMTSDPVTLPWISCALTRIEEILADLAPHAAGGA